VYDLTLEGEERPIGVTGRHPFWSGDRNQWVPANQLKIGERLKGLNGTAKVESLTLRDHSESVYNIEVDGDHCYRVGEQGLLAHNASCPAQRDTQALYASLGPSRLPVIAKAQAHHIFPVSEFNTDLGIQLCCWGIDLNSADNGVWLPYCDYPMRVATVHRGSHTQDYINYVVARLNAANSKADALAILADIKARLRDRNSGLTVNNADQNRPC
jgi:hypothetical protein